MSDSPPNASNSLLAQLAAAGDLIVSFVAKECWRLLQASGQHSSSGSAYFSLTKEEGAELFNRRDTWNLRQFYAPWMSIEDFVIPFTKVLRRYGYLPDEYELIALDDAAIETDHIFSEERNTHYTIAVRFKDWEQRQTTTPQP